ncbi:hypothetical protein [Lachnoclostridium sp.]|uniref:hypothetical protein n=1 Tax=Lachnoclostridium sp. TaxID=2028282 RepID=UPI002896623D|nr:hypothetical protein [Lachnoclostridium sp.]
MYTKTLRCYEDTYISIADNSNHSTATKLKTDNWPADQKNPTRYAAVLQFAIPNEIRFKKINSVKLSVTIKSDIGSGFGAVYYRAYAASSSIAELTFNNYASRGSVSSPILDKQTVSLNPGESYTKERDITELFMNNVVNNLFSVMVNVPNPNIDDLYILSNENSSSYPLLTIEYEDVLPVTPTLLYPVDVYADSDRELTFRWSFNTLTLSKQKGYVLQWRKSGESNWYTLSSETTNRMIYATPANTFPTGQIEWRLQTIDEIDQVSGFSVAQFVIKGKPSLPVITSIKNDALTVIEWTASDQVGYEAEIKKDGEIIYKSAKSTQETNLKPNLFLLDGSYELRLRTINSYSLWSNFASRIFTINTTKPNKPSISVSINGDIVNINTEFDTNTAYLYRIDPEEIILIAKLTDKKYIDTAIRCNEHSKYFVRSYNGGFTDSNQAVALALTSGFIVSDKYDIVRVDLSEERFIPFSEELSKEFDLVEYSGRIDPVVEDGEHERQVITRNAFVNEEQYAKLRRMFYKSTVVLYRDNRGIKLWCKITRLNRTNATLDMGYNIDISFTKVFYNEGVEVNE